MNTMTGYPVTVFGQVSSRGGHFTTQTLGKTIYGRLTLHRSHVAPLPLRNEHGELSDIGQVHYLERHEQSGATWAVATVWPSAADAIDWDVPRFFSPGGTGSVTNRRCDRNESYDDYDLSMRMDELSICENPAQNVGRLIVLGRYDIADKVSPGGWPTSMSGALKATLDRAWKATHASSYRHARSLDVVDIARPGLPPLQPTIHQRAATPNLDQVRALLDSRTTNARSQTIDGQSFAATAYHRRAEVPAELRPAPGDVVHRRTYPYRMTVS